jgi:hypothetical protein
MSTLTPQTEKGADGFLHEPLISPKETERKHWSWQVNEDSGLEISAKVSKQFQQDTTFQIERDLITKCDILGAAFLSLSR